ncbi:winged helix-turn-helix domain-containing protein [Streptomyces sp. NPDC097941]|uniref:winged helix-turn-helix domain-containing protein n=1 Tax=Streptomyces sp. NPDC097941 TaxID=3155685 RepID=UPI0033175A17
MDCGLVQTVVRRRLRPSLSAVATVWRLLKRHGWPWQAPARRARTRRARRRTVEIGGVAEVEASRRATGPGSSSRTNPGSP